MGSKNKFEINAPEGDPIQNGKKKGFFNRGKVKDSDEKEKEKKEKKEKEAPKIPPVNYTSLFRFATGGEKILIFFGLAAAVAGGSSMPIMVIFFGKVTQEMVGEAGSKQVMCEYWWGNSTGTTTPMAEDFDFISQMRQFAVMMIIIGCGTFLAMYTFITIFNYIAEKQVFKMRKLYLEALLRQNIGWYDTNQDKNFVSRISEDLTKVQDAMGEKVGLCLFFASIFFLSLGNAFYHGWKLTLVVLSSTPILAIATGLVASIQSRLVTTEQNCYAKAGTVAEEALGNVKTVMAFGGQNKEMELYQVGLHDARTAGKKRSAIAGFGVGLMWLIIYASYSLAFWYGTKLIMDDREKECKDNIDPTYTAENLLIIFFSVLMGAFNIGQSASYFEAFATGRGAAATIFNVIDRVPEIDSYSESGLKPKGRANGKITFENIKFHYPSRPDIEILKNFSLSVKPGQTVALVGHSGCGKSTILQLLQRFYDPQGGRILVDDNNIKELHLGWLREQIGVVSQEPVLFNTTIKENIRYGRTDVSDEEIFEATKKSNAYNFISRLPNGFDTQVGDRGAQLSGGQKQRVAIARALVREPSILLLDEATSALDTQSESVVQKALDRAREGRTTLIVAHRLTTIRAADTIVAINNGELAEAGTHEELLAQKGLYYKLVTTQVAGIEEDDDQGGQEVEQVVDLGNKKILLKQESRKSLTLEEDEEIAFVPAITEDELSEDELAKQAPIMRLLKMNKKEWKLIVLGIIMAIIQGLAIPAYAILFGEYLALLSNPNVDEAQKESNWLALAFLGIGIISGTAQFLQIFCFGIAGEELTFRIRQLSFKAMLSQELGFFDDLNNSVGALSSRLSVDAAAVQGASGARLGTIIQSLTTLISSMGVAMFYIPKLGAVCLAFVPVVLVGAYFEGMLMTGQNILEKKSLEHASKIAVQAVGNIRTVASLCKEKQFVNMYRDNLLKPHEINLKYSHIRGCIFGLAQSSPFFAYAAVMWYGGHLIKTDGEFYGDVFKVSEALIFGTMMVGQSIAFAPNYHKAKVSGARIVKLLDRRPAIENSPGIGLQIKSSLGSVLFDKVGFHYPTRPSAKILRGLSLGIEPGKSVALVGPSGCGKSTCVQLILRFYDPITGKVKFDENDVSALNLNALRNQMAIVAQEPALFDRTIKDNIAYGDHSKKLTMDQIIDAAKMANIHTFIATLPLGYDTRVGEMGTQLSGGQKQRVAIARSLIRNPKLLLLDEATSALDTESELVVQQALEVASEGRTSITIAHRLSSIQGVDRILVINNGGLAEIGSHSELLSKRGLYHKLWNLQSQNNNSNSNNNSNEKS